MDDEVERHTYPQLPVVAALPTRPCYSYAELAVREFEPLTLRFKGWATRKTWLHVREYEVDDVCNLLTGSLMSLMTAGLLARPWSFYGSGFLEGGMLTYTIMHLTAPLSFSAAVTEFPRQSEFQSFLNVLVEIFKNTLMRKMLVWNLFPDWTFSLYNSLTKSVSIEEAIF